MKGDISLFEILHPDAMTEFRRLKGQNILKIFSHFVTMLTYANRKVSIYADLKLLPFIYFITNSIILCSNETISLTQKYSFLKSNICRLFCESLKNSATLLVWNIKWHPATWKCHHKLQPPLRWGLWNLVWKITSISI